MSVHLGARDVLTWAVEKESATTVAEANAATEVVMLPDTLRMYTVLMTRVERESFDIFVGSDLEKVWKLGGVCMNAGTP